MLSLLTDFSLSSDSPEKEDALAPHPSRSTQTVSFSEATQEEALQETPFQTDFKTHLKRFFKRVSRPIGVDEQFQGYFESLCLLLPEAQRDIDSLQHVLTCAKSPFNRKIYPSEGYVFEKFEKVAKNLDRIIRDCPENERLALIKNINDFLSLGSEYGIDSKISNIRRMHKQDRAQKIELLMPLLRISRDDSMILNNYIDMAKNLTQDQFRLYVHLLISLLNKATPQEHWDIIQKMWDLSHGDPQGNHAVQIVDLLLPIFEDAQRGKGALEKRVAVAKELIRDSIDGIQHAHYQGIKIDKGAMIQILKQGIKEIDELLLNKDNMENKDDNEDIVKNFLENLTVKVSEEYKHFRHDSDSPLSKYKHRKDTKKAPLIVDLFFVLPDQREDVLKHCLPFTNHKSLSDILKAMEKIYPTDRENVIAHCLPYKKQISFAQIIESVGKVKKEEREAFMLLVNFFFQKTHPDGHSEIGNFFEVLSGLSISERDTVKTRVEKIESHFEQPVYLPFGSLSTLADISSSDWDSELKDALLLNQIFSPIAGDMANIYFIFLLIKKMPKGSCQELGPKISQLMQFLKTEEMDAKQLFSDFLTCIDQLVEISTEEIIDILGHSNSLMQKGYADFYSIIELLKPLSAAQRSEISQKWPPVSNFSTNEFGMMNFAKELSREQLLDLPRFYQAFIDGVGVKSDHYYYPYNHFRKAPPKDRFAALCFAEPYFKNLQSFIERQYLLEGLIAFGKDGYQQFIDLMFPFLTTINNNLDKLISVSAKLSVEERSEVIKAARRLSIDRSNGEDYAFVVEGLSGHPVEERSALVSLMQDYFGFHEKRIMKCQEIIKERIRFLSTFKGDEKVTSNISKLLPILNKGLTDLDEYAQNIDQHNIHELNHLMSKLDRWYAEDVYKKNDLESLGKIYQEHYSSFQSSDSRKDLMLTLRGIPAEERADLLSACRPLFHKIEQGQFWIVASMACIPIDQRGEATRMTFDILQTHSENDMRSDGFWRADILKIVDTISQLDPDRQDLIHRYINFLEKLDYEDLQNKSQNLSNENKKANVRFYLMRILNYLPLHQLERSLEALDTLQEQDPIGFKSLYKSLDALIGYLKQQGALDIDDLLLYWKDVLQTCSNKSRVKGFADIISHNYNSFGLLDENDVVLEAINIGILLEDSKNASNPYNIFKALHEKCQQPIDWSVIKPSIETLSGYKVSFNPEFIRDELHQFHLTFKELPFYSEAFLEDRVAHLDARIKEDSTLQTEILKMTTFSYELLKIKSLGDGTLYHLLKKEKGSSGQVGILKARFIAMVAYLQSLRPERKEGEFFSPQEESFLRMLASIVGCPAGKSEGINSYYLNVLPTENRYSARVDQKEYEESGAAYLNSKNELVAILSEEIEKMFTGHNYFMKSLVGLKHQDEVMQASHQATYLKNLIGHPLGLSSQKKFDAHTQLLYIHLIQLSMQEGVQHFYKYFLPHGYISRVCSTYGMDEEEVILQLKEMGIICIS